MAERFWRVRWAWWHTKLGWRELLAGVASGGFSVGLAHRYAWDVSPAEGAVVAGCLGAFVVWLVDFGLHFFRAHIEEREQAAARSIGDHLAAVIINRLKAEPKGKIEIGYLTAHKEPVRFAEQLKRILTEGGWEIAGFYTVFGDVATDMEISVRDSDNPPPRAAALKKLLEELGIVVTWGSGNPIWDADYVSLFVGDKS